MKRDPKGIFFSSPPSAWFGAISFIVVPIIGILAVVVSSNMISSIQRGRQKTTMKSLHRIGDRLERLKGPAGYPVLRSFDALISADSALPSLDGWNRPFKLISNANAYFIISAGKDGLFEQTNPHLYRPGAIVSFQEDLVYSNGRFIRKPEGS